MARQTHTFSFTVQAVMGVSAESQAEALAKARQVMDSMVLRDRLSDQDLEITAYLDLIPCSVTDPCSEAD